MANYGMLFETVLVIILSYVKGLEIALGGRAIACAHFAIPCFTYFTLEIMYDECRKIYVRRGIDVVDGQTKIKGWVARNTLY